MINLLVVLITGQELNVALLNPLNSVFEFVKAFIWLEVPIVAAILFTIFIVVTMWLFLYFMSRKIIR